MPAHVAESTARVEVGARIKREARANVSRRTNPIHDLLRLGLQLLDYGMFRQKSEMHSKLLRRLSSPARCANHGRRANSRALRRENQLRRRFSWRFLAKLRAAISRPIRSRFLRAAHCRCPRSRVTVTRCLRRHVCPASPACPVAQF